MRKIKYNRLVPWPKEFNELRRHLRQVDPSELLPDGNVRPKWTEEWIAEQIPCRIATVSAWTRGTLPHPKYQARLMKVMGTDLVGLGLSAKRD